MRSWKVTSAGIDWISATARSGSSRSTLAAVGARLIAGENDGDNTPRAWHWRGYVGWQCGSVVAGERADSYFCQVSGSVASLYWLMVLEAGPTVTRLDVQVTAGSPSPRHDEATHQWERIEGNGNLRRRAGWRQHILTRPTGSTLYVGSPKSDRRLRLYDKHAEDPEHYPPGSWRYEVQARHGLAGALAAGLADRDSSALACVASVHHCFSARGVQPRFRAGGVGLLGHVPRARTDAERTLAWIDRYVRPTVDRLRASGYGAVVDTLLGAR